MIGDRMKAAVFSETGKPLRIEDITSPKPGPSELIVKVRYCGICGSDLNAAASGALGITKGAVMGHEFSGEVVEVGHAVEGRWQHGDRVCSMPFISCGTCEKCLRGLPYECHKAQVIGFGQIPGAYAEYIRIGANETFRLPPEIDFRTGALIEPLAVGLHAVRMAPMKRGDNVLVIGADPIGLAVTVWCRFFGARHIIVSDTIPERRDISLNLGATGTVDPSQDVAPVYEALVKGPPDTIFECAGVPGLLMQCIEIAPQHGNIVCPSVCEQPDTLVPAVAVFKELTIQFAVLYSRSDFQFVIDMLAANRVNADAMVTDVVSLDEMPEMFESLHRKDLHCKVLVKPN